MLIHNRACISTFTTSAARAARIPAAYWRGGTSRAVFFHPHHLPSNRADWSAIFRAVIGSPDSNGRQLNGLGGGVSSLSKVCVVGRSQRADADVDFTFAALGVRDGVVDFSSNCGNMTAAVGPYAVDTGLVPAELSGSTTVRIFNTNTSKIIHSTFPTKNGILDPLGDLAIDGVAGIAAAIRLSFVNPAGSKTGRALPTGNVVDDILGVDATCIDFGNPCVFVRAADLEVPGTILPDDIDADSHLLQRLEAIRGAAAVAMGLVGNPSEAPGSIPKIAMLSSLPAEHKLLSGTHMQQSQADVVVRAMSVGQPHRAVPVTVAMAIGGAAHLPGSIVQQCMATSRASRHGLTIAHPTGTFVIDASLTGPTDKQIATVFRTARKIMDGHAYI